MPQHLLDRPQIRSLLQHVRAERMPQRMRMHIGRQPPAQRNLLHDPPDTSRRQPASPPRLQFISSGPSCTIFPLPAVSSLSPAVPADTPESPPPLHLPAAPIVLSCPYQTPESHHRPTECSSRSNPTNSELRIPDPYSSSKITRSRAGHAAISPSASALGGPFIARTLRDEWGCDFAMCHPANSTPGSTPQSPELSADASAASACSPAAPDWTAHTHSAPAT